MNEVVNEIESSRLRWAGRAILCERLETNYLKRYYGQILEVNEDVAGRKQDGLMGFRKTQGNRVLEFGWRMSRIDGAGDVCLRRSRPTQDCRTDDDNGLKQVKH
jgi:hypothetical protein